MPRFFGCLRHSRARVRGSFHLPSDRRLFVEPHAGQLIKNVLPTEHFLFAAKTQKALLVVILAHAFRSDLAQLSRLGTDGGRATAPASSKPDFTVGAMRHLNKLRLEPINPVRCRVGERRFIGDHFSEQSASDRPKRKAKMMMTEVRPQSLVPRYRPDDR